MKCWQYGVVMSAACVLVSCSAVKVNVNGEEMTLNEALGGMEGGGETQQFVMDANTTVASSVVEMPLSTAVELASERGYVCDSANALIMDPPIARITVEQAQRLSFSLTSEGRKQGWIIVHQNGEYICGERKEDGVNQVFEPGTYAVHAAWRSGSVDRVKQAARQETRPIISFTLKSYGIDDAHEEIVLDEKTQNPYFSNGASYRGGFVQARELGAKQCEIHGLMSAQPVMEITVDAKQPALEVRDTPLVTWALISESGEIACGNPRIEQSGRYKIHALTSADAEVLNDPYFMFSPVFWDQTREVTLTGEVPRFEIDRFERPIIIEGITRPDTMTSTRGCNDDQAVVNFEPDFFLEFKRPSPGTRVMLLPYNGLEQELVAEDITTRPLLMKKERECERSMQPERFARRRYSLDTADGTYAGFVAHSGAPRDFVAIVWAEGTTIDPWLMPVDLPVKIDTVDSRVFTRYYPLWHDAPVNELEAWERVPESLHVYVKERAVAKKSTSQSASTHTRGGDPLEVRAGEAVLLVDVLDRRKTGQPGKVRIFTSDGWDMVIDGFKLTTAHPDTWQ